MPKSDIHTANIMSHPSRSSQKRSHTDSLHTLPGYMSTRGEPLEVDSFAARGKPKSSLPRSRSACRDSCRRGSSMLTSRTFAHPSSQPRVGSTQPEGLPFPVILTSVMMRSLLISQLLLLLLLATTRLKKFAMPSADCLSLRRLVSFAAAVARSPWTEMRE